MEVFPLSSLGYGECTHVKTPLFENLSHWRCSQLDDDVL